MDELVERVLAGIATNNDKLGGVELRMQTILEDLSVEKETRREIRSSNGSVRTIVEVPRIESESQATIFGSRLRFDVVGDDGSNQSSFIRTEDNLSREYLSGAKSTANGRGTLTIRRNDQLPFVSEVDPRQFCAYSIKFPLATTLQEQLVAATEREDGTIEFDLKMLGGGKFVILCATTVGHLPVRSMIYYEGGIVTVSEIKYQHLESRNAWLPEQGVRRHYTNGGVKTYDAPGWTQVETTNVTEVRLLEPAEALEQIDRLPTNLVVQDHTKGWEPAKEPSPSKSNPVFWIFVVNVAVVGIAMIEQPLFCKS